MLTTQTGDLKGARIRHEDRKNVIVNGAIFRSPFRLNCRMIIGEGDA